MKPILIFCLLELSSHVASAASYKLSLELQIKNETPIKKSFVVEEGEQRQVTIDNKIIRFTPTFQNKDAVKISSVILEDSKIISSPIVIVRLNQAAEMSEADKGGNKIFSIRWIPELASKE